MPSLDLAHRGAVEADEGEASHQESKPVGKGAQTEHGEHEGHETHEEQEPVAGKPAESSSAPAAATSPASGKGEPGKGAVSAGSPARHAGIARRVEGVGAGRVGGQAHVCGPGCNEHSASPSAGAGRVAGEAHVCGDSCKEHGGRARVSQGKSKHDYPHEPEKKEEKAGEDKKDKGKDKGKNDKKDKQPDKKADKDPASSPAGQEPTDAASKNSQPTATASSNKGAVGSGAAPGIGQLAPSLKAAAARTPQVGMGFVGVSVGPGTPGEFPASMTVGFTTWDRNAKPPELRITSEEVTDKKGKTSWVAKVERTTSSDQTVTAIAMSAGDYDLKRQVDDLDDQGEPAKFDEWMKLTGADNATIIAGEKEHVADCELAYKITLKAVESAINAAAGKKFTGKDKETAEKKAKDAVVGRLPPKLKPITNAKETMDALCDSAAAFRDSASHKVTNTFLKRDSAEKKVWSKLKKEAGFAVGSTPSAALVKV